MSYGSKDCPVNRRVARLVRVQRIGNLQKKRVESSRLLPDRLGSGSTRFRIDQGRGEAHKLFSVTFGSYF
jgi:hypothetical protein